jgi:hypothetical protein
VRLARVLLLSSSTAVSLCLASHPTANPCVSTTARVPGPRMPADTADTGIFEIELFSPAKVCLFLRILGRRDDGFHDSASLSQTVDVGDSLRLARIPGDRFAAAGVVRPSRTSEPIKQHAEFSVSSPGSQLPAGFPLDQSNMVVRALVNAARSETRATVTYSFGRARCEKPL